jgi:hypothetical protein
MKRISRLAALMLLIVSLTAVAYAGDMQGPTGSPTPPPPPPVTDPIAGDISAPVSAGVATNADADILSGNRYLFDLLLAAIF